MRIRCQFMWPSRGAPSSLVERVAMTLDRHPEHAIIRGEFDPETVGMATRLLDEAGVPRVGAQSSFPDGPLRPYRVRRHRVYDDHDLASCDLLTLDVTASPYPRSDRGVGLGRSSNGEVRLLVEDLPEDPGLADAVSDASRWIAVSGVVRRTLERADVTGLGWTPTIPVEPRADEASVRSTHDPRAGRLDPIDRSPFAERPWRDDEDPWHELTPIVTMPPVAPGMRVRHTWGEEAHPGDEDAVVHDDSGFDGVPEYRYRRADLDALPPFDVAHVRERGGDMTRLVVSKRVHRACAHLALRWVPVHVVG